MEVLEEQQAVAVASSVEVLEEQQAVAVALSMEVLEEFQTEDLELVEEVLEGEQWMVVLSVEVLEVELLVAEAEAVEF